MARWYYPSIFDELEDIRKYQEALSRQMYETSPTPLLTGPADITSRMLPATRAGLHVDVTDTDKEVVVTTGVLAGVSKKDITLTLIAPQALEISCEQREERQEEDEGFFLRERRFGCITRVIPLPHPVREEGTSATFKNGVLEVHLKKTERDLRGKISID